MDIFLKITQDGCNFWTFDFNEKVGDSFNFILNYPIQGTDDFIDDIAKDLSINLVVNERAGKEDLGQFIARAVKAAITSNLRQPEIKKLTINAFDAGGKGEKN